MMSDSELLYRTRATSALPNEKVYEVIIEPNDAPAMRRLMLAKNLKDANVLAHGYALRILGLDSRKYKVHMLGRVE